MEKVKKFFFIRPRRFGKSLWISVLMDYYDLNRKEKFDSLFEGLYIQKNPTPLRNSYLILKFDFSGLTTISLDALRNDFNFRVRGSVEEVFRANESLLGKENYLRFKERSPLLAASQMISELKKEAHSVGAKVYTFIDEYDHFANKLAAEGKESFVNDIISRTGFVREFYEQMKIASGEGVFERFYITGVSPIMLDELASGFNIMSNMTTHPEFNEMLGFTNAEVRSVLDMIPEERYAAKSKEEVFSDLVFYYNGYKFSEDSSSRVFNSDMVLYFFQYFNDVGYPKEILDQNVKTDYSRLKGLIVGSSGKENLKQIIEEINTKQVLSFPLVSRFSFEARLNSHELKSLLYFFGLITMSDLPNQFVIPNYVIRNLHWEYLQKFLEESGIEFDMNLLYSALREMSETGEVNHLKELALDFFQNRLSSYDYSGLTEKHVKFMFISYFTLSRLYNIVSEREIAGRKRIDLLFEAHPAYYNYVKYNFIIEFKYIRKSDSPEEAEKKRTEAAAQAKEYYEIYRRDFKQFGRELRSVAMIVSHTKEVEFLKIAGFSENETLLPRL